jgi:hypothetical protein
MAFSENVCFSARWSCEEGAAEMGTSDEDLEQTVLAVMKRSQTPRHEGKEV